MRCALILAMLLVVCGCGRPPAKPAAAAAIAAPAPKSVDFRIEPTAFLDEVQAGESAANSIVQWEVILAQFKVDDTGRHGLTNLFKELGEKNLLIEEEISRSPLVQLGRGNSNIVLQLAAGAYAARCTFEDSTNLLNHLQSSAGVDVLSQPKANTKGTNTAMMQVANTITVALGGDSRTASTTIPTTQINVGPTVSVRLLSTDRSHLAIEASSRVEQFHGYDPAVKNTARPIFSVAAMGTRARLRTNEVLLLGGPIEMNVVKSVSRVAYLSEVPAIGRLFTKTEVHTNFVRTLIMVRPRIQ